MKLELTKSKENVASLEKDIESKVKIIKTLNQEKIKKEQEVTHYKKENSIKTEQLKEKNKILEKIKTSLDKETTEHENVKENFLNKTKNFQNVIDNLNKYFQTQI